MRLLGTFRRAGFSSTILFSGRNPCTSHQRRLLAQCGLLPGPGNPGGGRTQARFPVLLRQFRIKPLSGWEFGRSLSYATKPSCDRANLLSLPAQAHRIRIATWLCIFTRAGFIAEARRRNEILPLEGAIERSLGLISNLSRDLGNTAAACSQYLCSELQPPSRQIRYSWFAQIMPEALGQNGT